MHIIDEYVKIISTIYKARMELFKNTKVDERFKERYLKKYDKILNKYYESLWNFMTDTTDN